MQNLIHDQTLNFKFQYEERTVDGSITFGQFFDLEFKKFLCCFSKFMKYKWLINDKPLTPVYNQQLKSYIKNGDKVLCLSQAEYIQEIKYIKDRKEYRRIESEWEEVRKQISEERITRNQGVRIRSRWVEITEPHSPPRIHGIEMLRGLNGYDLELSEQFQKNNNQQVLDLQNVINETK